MNVDKEMEKEVKRLAGKDVALTNLTNLLKKKHRFCISLFTPCTPCMVCDISWP